MTPDRGDRLAVVARLSSMGDVVLTEPVLSALHRAGWRTALLTRRAYAPLFEAHPSVHEVWRFEDLGLWGWLKEMRRRRPGLYIDLHGTARTRLWGLLSGAGLRVRYRKRAWARRLLVWFKRAMPALSGRTVDRYLETVESLGLPVTERTPRLKPAPIDPRDPMGPGPFVGVAPGARHATKRWLPEYFAQTADRLADEWAVSGARLPVVVFGSSDDAGPVAETLARLKGPAHNLAGRTSVRDLMAWLSRCAVLLTNDSGAMHVAAALGTPTVAVFGPTVRDFGFFPSGPRAGVLEAADLACRPCSLHGSNVCPQGHFMCMKEVRPDRAVALALALVRGDDS